VLLLTLTGWALLMSSNLDTAPHYKAWVQDHEVWMETDGGDRLVVYDPLAAEPVAASPAGDRVVYAVLNPNFDADHCANTPRKYIVLTGAFGQPLWRAGADACNDFDKFEWIDDGRIGVMTCGHANCLYWILDSYSGKTLAALGSGFDFLWSHNRQWVAHRHVKMNDEDGALLMFNDDTIIYPPVDTKTRQLPNREIGELTWSPDDNWVSFAETDYPGYDAYVVSVSFQGKALRESLPVDVQSDTKIEWTDVSHFQIRASNKTFKFIVDGKGLQEIEERTK
jgi:hypothetical protein